LTDGFVQVICFTYCPTYNTYFEKAKAISVGKNFAYSRNKYSLVTNSEWNGLVTLATLCHIIKGNQLLLKKAVRGISKGKWNAPGGKILGKETPTEGAEREVLEETGLKVNHIFYHGSMDYYMFGKQTLHTRAYLFSTTDFHGRIKPNGEGSLRWFNRDELPYRQMWPDDRYWIPHLLLGSQFNAKFYLDDDNSRVVRYAITSRDGVRDDSVINGRVRKSSKARSRLLLA
jgi:8-oxo-dGTP pyrophosphatase MutT (NUDIX family)